MFNPVFTFSLGQSIKEGMVSLAYLDEKTPSLVSATIGGKIIIHSLHSKDFKEGSDIALLNFNKEITSIATGKLEQGQDKDYVFISSLNTLIAYDTENNSDLFFKEISDGVNVITVGSLDSVQNLAIVGGNCSIQGFDSVGEEQFWTVTGDNVSAMALCDIDEDGIEELLVGSDDFVLRIFKKEEILYELTETARIITLTGLPQCKFAFGCENGSIGLYQKQNRLWRIKSSHKPLKIIGLEESKDGITGILVGWSNGKIEIRSEVSGEVLGKISIQQNLAQLIKCDYRLDRTQQVLSIDIDGQVKGFTVTNMRDTRVESKNFQKMNEMLQDLQTKKNELQNELQILTDPTKSQGKQDPNIQLIPANTQISCAFRFDFQQKCPALVFSTNNSAIIKAVIISSDQVFDQETKTFCPQNSSTNIVCPLHIKKNISTELGIKILLGISANSSQYQVIEMKRKISKFSTFMLTDQKLEISSAVYFVYKERMPRFAKWLDQCFLIDEKLISKWESQDLQQLDVTFINLQDTSPLTIQINSTTGQIKILSNNMEIAGEIIQDLANYMNIQELESNADFPIEFDLLRETIKNIQELNSARLLVTADMAEAVTNVKNFIVRAEDSRISFNMADMKKMYGNLMIENRKLTAELLKKINNHQSLTTELKKINSFINKAANLRIGQPKARIVTLCREAIKNNNLSNLVLIIQKGQEII